MRAHVEHTKESLQQQTNRGETRANHARRELDNGPVDDGDVVPGRVLEVAKDVQGAQAHNGCYEAETADGEHARDEPFLAAVHVEVPEHEDGHCDEEDVLRDGEG